MLLLSPLKKKHTLQTQKLFSPTCNKGSTVRRSNLESWPKVAAKSASKWVARPHYTQRRKPQLTDPWSKPWRGWKSHTYMLGARCGGGGKMKMKIQSSPDGILARCTAEPTGDCPVVVVVVSLLLSSFLSGFLSCFFWEPKHGKQPILYIPLLISACYPHSHTHTLTLCSSAMHTFLPHLPIRLFSILPKLSISTSEQTPLSLFVQLP